MSGAPQVSVDYDSLRLAVGELGQMTPVMRSELRRGLRLVGASTLSSAKGHASWSTRIPGAITLRVSTSSRSAGIYLRVDSAKAPHARPFEGLSSRTGFFRHPVFGDTDVWVAQRERRFLLPAVLENRAGALRAAEDAITAAARAGRFT